MSLYCAPLSANLHYSCTGWASSTTLASSTTDPATVESLRALEEGTQKLEDGDLESANALYLRSIQVKRQFGCMHTSSETPADNAPFWSGTPSALFNYGVTCYHLSKLLGVFRKSVALLTTTCRGLYWRY